MANGNGTIDVQATVSEHGGGTLPPVGPAEAAIDVRELAGAIATLTGVDIHAGGNRAAETAGGDGQPRTDAGPPPAHDERTNGVPDAGAEAHDDTLPWR